MKLINNYVMLSIEVWSDSYKYVLHWPNVTHIILGNLIYCCFNTGAEAPRAMCTVCPKYSVILIIAIFSQKNGQNIHILFLLRVIVV